MTSNTPQGAADESGALNLFTGCHAQIRKKMELMRQVPAMVAGDPKHAAQAAADIVSFFETTVQPHHREEERELWPMLDKCSPGTEGHETVQAIVHRLKHEHTRLETLWSQIEPAMRKIARAKPAELDAQKVAQLTDMYDQHAAFEDAVVLPMARYLMDPIEQYRLAMSMALSRHPTPAYI